MRFSSLILVQGFTSSTKNFFRISSDSCEFQEEKRDSLFHLLKVVNALSLADFERRNQLVWLVLFNSSRV